MGIAHRSGVATAAALAALSLVIGACGESSGRSASTASTPSGTTSTTSPVAAALATSGAHDLPNPPLTTPRIDTVQYTQAGDAVLAWGGYRDTSPGVRSDFIPNDVGALLSPRTLTWTKLPTTPFDHPTAYPQLTWAAGRVVLVGNSCVAAPPPTAPAEGEGDAGNPNCPLGPVQAAVFDLGTSRWKTVAVPSSATGYVQQALPVGDRVLVVLSDQNSGDDSFALLDPTARTWTALAAPATGKPEVICASDGIAFAVNIRAKTAGKWIEAETTTSGGSDFLYGQVQASSLTASATSWSTPGAEGLESGAAQAVAGCVGGGVLVVGSGTGYGDAGQTGAWLWQPGGAWVAMPDPPPSPHPDMTEVGQMAASRLDHDQLMLDSPSVGDRVFDGTTHQWSVSPALPGGASPVGVHIGSSELAFRSSDNHLVAVTP